MFRKWVRTEFVNKLFVEFFFGKVTSREPDYSSKIQFSFFDLCSIKANKKQQNTLP